MTNKLYKLMNWAGIEEIIYSESDNPHELLGPHRAGNQTLLQAYFPGAKQVTVQWDFAEEAEDHKECKMEIADEDGYFAACIPVKELGFYRYSVSYDEEKVLVTGDPYRHKSLITKEDVEKFQNGIHYTIYEKLGAHPMTLDGEAGTYFAVWAPNAMRISVVGDFRNEPPSAT